MQIGIVAKKIGLSVDAIRFYERNALLPRPPRTEGGFRLYGESDVETFDDTKTNTDALVKATTNAGFPSQTREGRQARVFCGLCATT